MNAGSISKAAEQLSISQSALSRKIQLLEEELGYTLFVRNRGVKQTTLTPQGKSFLILAEKMMHLYDEMKSLRNYNERRVLRISAPEAINSTIMRGVYASFLQKHPDIKLSIENNQSDVTLQRMREGLFDLGYVCLPYTSENIRCNTYFKEKIVFVCSKDAVYADGVTPEQLDIRKCIYFNVSVDSAAWFQQRFTQKEAYFAYVDKLSFFDRALFDDNRWAMVPYYVAQELVRYDGLVIKRMDDRPADRSVYCMCRSNGENSDLANLFEEYANAYLLEHYGIQVDAFAKE